MNHRLATASALALFALAPLAAKACATCGCSLSSDAATGYSAGPGWRIDLQYSYIDQSQLRTGTGAISAPQIAAINNNGGNQEVEKDTINRYLTLGVAYSPTVDWNFSVQVPYVSRSHSTYSNATTDQLTPSNLSSTSFDDLGDVRLIATYQGILPTNNFGVQLGGAEVVEKIERRCALHGNIIHAVVDEVGSHAGVQAELRCQRQLIADAVRRGDQHGIREACAIERKEAGKAPNFRQHILVEGAAGEAFDLVVGLCSASMRWRRRWVVVERSLTRVSRGFFMGRLLQGALPFLVLRKSPCGLLWWASV